MNSADSACGRESAVFFGMEKFFRAVILSFLHAQNMSKRNAKHSLFTAYFRA